MRRMEMLCFCIVPPPYRCDGEVVRRYRAGVYPTLVSAPQNMSDCLCGWAVCNSLRTSWQPALSPPPQRPMALRAVPELRRGIVVAAQ